MHLSSIGSHLLNEGSASLISPTLSLEAAVPALQRLLEYGDPMQPPKPRLAVGVYQGENGLVCQYISLFLAA